MNTVRTDSDVHRILYATDFSAVAERAGEYAAGLARSLGASLEIGHVLPTPSDERSEGIWQAERERREQRLALQSSNLEQVGLHAHSSVCTECPASLAISLMQKRTGADLIVVGTESKSSLDRLFLGSTAEALIRESPVPVLTVGPHVKTRGSEPAFRKIVLATDFSQTSTRAEKLALSLTLTLGASLHILNLSKSEAAEEVSRHWTAEAAFRNRVLNLLPPNRCEFSNGQDGEGHNHIGESIVQFATNVHADLIVMGARERSFWLLHVRRGVTQDVLSTAECPVMTVRGR